MEELNGLQQVNETLTENLPHTSQNLNLHLQNLLFGGRLPRWSRATVTVSHLGIHLLAGFLEQ
jgi:hypothetical protein